jgi:DnaJ-class molecular chaperone
VASCSLCKGSGKLDDILKPILKDAEEIVCPACNGTGQIEEKKE